MDLVVGQRYKFHWKKGYNLEDREGKDPNRYYFSGTYTGTQAHPLPDGSTMTYHYFSSVEDPYGTRPSMSVSDATLDHLVPVKMTSGGRRRRASRRRTTRRRTTRRHR